MVSSAVELTELKVSESHSISLEEWMQNPPEDAAVLPQSFPLSAEIVSPTNLAEDVIARSQEYLQSGGEEVWLVFPENKWIIVVTQSQQLIFTSGKTVSTQMILQGFSIAVDDLLA